MKIRHFTFINMTMTEQLLPTESSLLKKMVGKPLKNGRNSSSTNDTVSKTKSSECTPTPANAHQTTRRPFTAKTATSKNARRLPFLSHSTPLMVNSSKCITMAPVSSTRLVKSFSKKTAPRKTQWNGSKLIDLSSEPSTIKPT